MLEKEKLCTFWYSARRSSAPKPWPARAAQTGIDCTQRQGNQGAKHHLQPLAQYVPRVPAATPTSMISAMIRGITSSNVPSKTTQTLLMTRYFL